MWANAVKEEINFLREIETFTLTPLTEAHAVEGRRVYTTNKNVNRSATYKARYVSKGYSQDTGIDNKTFSLTADMMSVH